MIPGVGGKFGRIIKSRERNRKRKGKSGRREHKLMELCGGRRDSGSDDDVGKYWVSSSSTREKGIHVAMYLTLYAFEFEYPSHLLRLVLCFVG